MAVMLSVALPNGSHVRSVVVTTSPGAPGVPCVGATSCEARQFTPPRSGGGGAATALEVENSSTEAAANAAGRTGFMRDVDSYQWGGYMRTGQPDRSTYCAPCLAISRVG